MINKEARELASEYLKETGEHAREFKKVYVTYKLVAMSLPIIREFIKFSG